MVIDIKVQYSPSDTIYLLIDTDYPLIQCWQEDGRFSYKIKMGEPLFNYENHWRWLQQKPKQQVSPF